MLVFLIEASERVQLPITNPQSTLKPQALLQTAYKDIYIIHTEFQCQILFNKILQLRRNIWTTDLSDILSACPTSSASYSISVCTWIDTWWGNIIKLNLALILNKHLALGTLTEKIQVTHMWFSKYFDVLVWFHFNELVTGSNQFTRV